MEAFVTKKRRRSVSPPAAQDEDSTELKLAMLASLQPGLSQDILIDALLAAEGDVELASSNILGSSATPPPLKRHKSVGHQTSLASTFSLASDAACRTLTKKGQTLHLFSPADVEAHTPCSIIHNFLPAEQANALLSELLSEAPTFSRASFQMFERTVTSPHSFGFYVDDAASAERHKVDYYYNGRSVSDVRPLLPHMRTARDMVGAAVNDEIARRMKDFYPGGKKLRYQDPGEWKPNACFVNCYAGGAESVGYHADQLTYLGPRAVIGSLSLGVAREFRARREGEGAVAIHLPHNSLLVMHAEMQEEWKHAIAPAQSIDPHPLAGNRRLNITYRYYRDEFHPRFTPRCRCGVPACLRCVMKKAENKGRYMWMCDTRYNPEGKECGFFEWAEFDDDGKPIWKEKKGT